MFESVPDYQLEATVELGDINVETTKSRTRESTGYISRGRRLFPQKTKNEERMLSLGFFLQRLSFLGHQEVMYLFKCVDSIQNVSITKKNNIIISPYIIVITMAAKGYKFTESVLELLLPELYNERSKRFKFTQQIRSVQEKLGYTQNDYYTYTFEDYYSMIVLMIRERSDGIFDIRNESVIVASLAEETYRFYFIQLKSNSVQWSISTGSLINQLVNTVLYVTLYMLERSLVEDSELICKLTIETPLPYKMLIQHIKQFSKLINEMKRLSSFNINKKDTETLSSFYELL
ncbi:VITF-3 [Sea otter poxvirus]|uniref:Intermediate transcription factor 3 small subunit n=1 Tax=Sea otter poxvirus TaxID=1416741 RepID=A0A2U9QHU7_9POXV|nr:VITF-3 [Sea otter poxvirus]AWU47142.1 VITF-3 [Sea otter poxvirus]